MFSSYNQSRRNGTLIPLHLTNRNGVPVHFEPWIRSKRSKTFEQD